MTDLDILKHLSIQTHEILYQLNKGLLQFDGKGVHIKTMMNKIKDIIIDSRIDDNNLLNNVVTDLEQAASSSVYEPSEQGAGVFIGCDGEFREILKNFVRDLDQWDIARK